MVNNPTWRELFTAQHEKQLPQLSVDQSRFVSSQMAVARAFNVNNNTVAAWLRQGCPGDPGFDLHAIAAWVDDYHRNKAEREVEAIRGKAAGKRAFAETLDDVGELFNVCKASVFKWIDAGAPSRGEQGYDVSAIADWLCNRTLKKLPESYFHLAAKHPRFIESTEEAARLLGVHEKTVRKWIKEGAPNRVGFDLHAVREWLQAKRAGVTAIGSTRPAWEEVCDVAEGILRRPPVLSDLDEDLAALVLRKFVKLGNDKRFIQVRARLLDGLSEYATKRFNYPRVDVASIPLARRASFDDMPERLDVVPIPKFDDIPKSYNRKILEMELTGLLTIYIRERLIGRSANTVRLINSAIASFSDWLGRPAVVGDLRQNKMLDYLAYQVDAGRLARASIKTHCERLLALWRFCSRKRWLPDFPEIAHIHVPERTPDAWSREEMESLVAAGKRRKGRVADVPAGLWWETIFMVTYDTAERIGAVLKLRFDDISTDGWILASAETRKGKTRDKRFKLRPETLEKIKQIRKELDPKRKLIFEWDKTNTYLYRIFAEILADAGLPSTRRTKFHKIRRTTASEFEAAGGNATDLLDHASRKTTMKYLDPSVLNRVQPADIVPGIGQKIEQAIETGDDSELLATLRKLVEERSKQKAS